jgi:hypothetical protein
LIAERAQLIWSAAGSPLEEDISIWLRAERELISEAACSDEPEVIDPEMDTAFGEIGSVPNLDVPSKSIISAGESFEFTSNARKGTSL